MSISGLVGSGVGLTFAGSMILMQELKEPQQWTLLGLLALVLTGVGIGAYKIANNGIARQIKSQDRVVTSLDNNTKITADLVTETKLLTQQNSIEMRERLYTLNNLRQDILNVPTAVVRALKETKS